MNIHQISELLGATGGRRDHITGLQRCTNQRAAEARDDPVANQTRCMSLSSNVLQIRIPDCFGEFDTSAAHCRRVERGCVAQFRSLASSVMVIPQSRVVPEGGRDEGGR